MISLTAASSCSRAASRCWALCCCCASCAGAVERSSMSGLGAPSSISKCSHCAQDILRKLTLHGIRRVRMRGEAHRLLVSR